LLRELKSEGLDGEADRPKWVGDAQLFREQPDDGRQGAAQAGQMIFEIAMKYVEDSGCRIDPPEHMEPPVDCLVPSRSSDWERAGVAIQPRLPSESDAKLKSSFAKKRADGLDQ